MTWTQRFLALALHVAEWSKDPSTKVGAVVVDSDRIVLSLGYNGFPRGVIDSTERLSERPVKYAFTVHAEANALLNASRSVRGATLYCTLLPCSECAKLVIQAGIRRVVCPAPAEGYERWADSFRMAREMFQESGVKLQVTHE